MSVSVCLSASVPGYEGRSQAHIWELKVSISVATLTVPVSADGGGAPVILLPVDWHPHEFCLPSWLLKDSLFPSFLDDLLYMVVLAVFHALPMIRDFPPASVTDSVPEGLLHLMLPLSLQFTSPFGLKMGEWWSSWSKSLRTWLLSSLFMQIQTLPWPLRYKLSLRLYQNPGTKVSLFKTKEFLYGHRYTFLSFSKNPFVMEHFHENSFGWSHTSPSSLALSPIPQALCVNPSSNVLYIERWHIFVVANLTPCLLHELCACCLYNL